MLQYSLNFIGIILHGYGVLDVVVHDGRLDHHFWSLVNNDWGFYKSTAEAKCIVSNL